MIPTTFKKSGSKLVYEDFKYPKGIYNSSGQLPYKVIDAQDETYQKWRRRSSNYDGFIEDCIIALAEELVKNG